MGVGTPCSNATLNHPCKRMLQCACIVHYNYSSVQALRVTSSNAPPTQEALSQQILYMVLTIKRSKLRVYKVDFL